MVIEYEPEVARCANLMLLKTEAEANRRFPELAASS